MPRSETFLVLDIETIVDPGLPIAAKADPPSPALPAPPHHQVVTVGALWFDASYRVLRFGIVGEHKAEEQVLSDFVRFVEERRPTLVTYNGRGFDLPVIVARCLRHGIPFRHYYQSTEVRYRFSPAGHMDLMDYLSDFGAARAVSLDTYAKLIGLPGKVGVEGKDVGPMVHAGRLGEVYAYCLCDVAQTAALFLRVELLRGRLDLGAYQSAMGGWLEAMGQEPRVGPVLQGLDRIRLLLEGAGTVDRGDPSEARGAHRA